jgi:small-conductance mechanosensitive channel
MLGTNLLAAAGGGDPDRTIGPALSAVAGLGSGFRSFVLWVTSIEGQAITALAVAALVAGAILAAKHILRAILLRRGAEHGWRALLLALVDRLLLFFAIMTGLRVGISLVEEPKSIDDATRILFTLAAALQAARWAQAVAYHLLDRVIRRHDGDHSTLASADLVLRWLANLIIWSAALLVFLDNLGVNVTTLVAGLGIGGVAIALAAQTTVGNLFSALSIILDKPFSRGDQISFGGRLATVEEIGMRATRLRSIDGQQIVVANSKLLDEPIDNFRRMAERRVALTVGVVYETPPDVLRAIPGIVEACVAPVPRARFARCHLAAFGPSSLDYELVLFSLSSDFAAMMDVKHAVLLNIFEAFVARGIGIAYPTQTLILRHESGAKR